MKEITFEQFGFRLARAIRSSPEKHKELLEGAGELALDRTAEETPEIKGRLKASFKRIPYKGKKEWEIEVEGDTVHFGSNVYYARMVEEGHALVLRRGKGKKKKVGHVSGKHFLQKGYEAAEKELPDLAEKFFGELGRGLGMRVKR